MSDSATPPALRLRLETDQPAYAPGDSMRVRLTVSHRSGPPVVLEFSTSQRCDFEIRSSAGATLWRWSADRAFGQMMGQETVASDRPPLVCTESISVPRTPGRYQIVGTLVAIEQRLTATANVTVGTARSRP